MQQKEFAARVKQNGVPHLMATRDESIAMHQVLSGMFDAEIKRVDDLTKKLSTHEDAIKTVAQINAMRAEAEEFSAKAVKDAQEATDTLDAARKQAGQIIEDAKAGAAGAIASRNAALLETSRQAEALIDDARKQASELTAQAEADLKQLANSVQTAKASLADYEARVAAANKQLSDLNKTVEGEKARLIKLFDK